MSFGPPALEDARTDRVAGSANGFSKPDSPARESRIRLLNSNCSCSRFEKLPDDEGVRRNPFGRFPERAGKGILSSRARRCICSSAKSKLIALFRKIS